jgi:hypothetical protein
MAIRRLRSPVRAPLAAVIFPFVSLVAFPVAAQSVATGARAPDAAAQVAAPPQTPATASAAGNPDAEQLRAEIERLRAEFETIRDSYGARLAALEARVAAIDTSASPSSAAAAQAAGPPPTGAEPAPAAEPLPAAPPVQTAQAPPTQAEVPQGAAGGGGPTGALPVYGAPTATSKVFNPDIAVIGNFLGAVGDNQVNPSPAFRMNEAEATFQAVVDPYARADFFFSFSPEGVEIEEGFLTFPTLPGGLLMKVGKFKEQIGKVNTLHPHTLPWVDTPVVMTNLLGSSEGMSDSGISVSKLILNPLFFLEATGEVYEGSSGIFQSHERSDVSWVGRLRGYRDITESTNLDVGGSFAYGHNDAGLDTTTKLFAVDATFRYRPLQRAIYKRFVGRTELFWSHRGQDVGDVAAFGMYGSGDYQFARRWFAGARYDWSERATNAQLTDKGPSLVLTYWPSEFSQIRGQFRHMKYAEGTTANELLFQFLFSIGAHGAHVF